MPSRSAPATATARPAWSRIDWLVLAAVTLGAGLLRLVRVGRPGELVFDEVFYAQNACWFVEASPLTCGIDGLVSRAHPPLGNWLIGAGIGVFGYDPLGWRVAAVAAGTLTVALLFVLARRLVGSTLAAGIAAGLLAIDFLHFVHSRLAMLDVFVALFGVAAFLFLVLDRDRLLSRGPGRTPAGWTSRLLLGRPWRLAAGAAAGAAIACKWSGALVLLGVIGLTLVWEIRSRQTDGRGWAVLRTLAQEGPSIVIGLVLVPVLVYVASYVGTDAGGPGVALTSPVAFLREVFRHQLAMLTFHTGLQGHHPYESPPWTWVLLKRPVAYYFDTFQGNYQEILALGNPLVWWASLVALAYLVVQLVRRRSLFGPEVVILTAFLFTLVPWVVLRGDRSQVFLFYLLVTVPFMCLALGYAVDRLAGAKPGRVVTALFVAASVGAFGFYYPVLAALPISPPAWEARAIFTDCVRPDGTAQLLPDDETSQGEPPQGWCWR